MLFSVSALMADQIYLKDAEIRKGKIIRITDNNLEFDPEGDRPFDVVDKKNVIRIVYDNGAVTIFKIDTLYKVDGTIIKGSIITVTKENITFMPEGAKEHKEQKIISRNEIVRIKYGEGKMVYMPKIQDASEEVSIQGKTQTGGFHDSIVRISGFFGFGNPTHGVFDKERRVLRMFKADLLQAYLLPHDYQIENSIIAGGGEIDVMPPAIKFSQKRSFDITGIKFGIRGRYGFEFVDSTIVDENKYLITVESFEKFRGRLLSYHYWAGGPVVNFIFSPRNNMLNFLINIYFIAGQIFEGNLRAAAALRSASFLTVELARLAGFSPYLPSELANITNTRYFNTTSFTGSTFRFGIGPHVTWNKILPITVGINITYAYSRLKLGRALPIYYDGNKRASHHEVGGEITAGAYF